MWATLRLCSRAVCEPPATRDSPGAVLEVVTEVLGRSVCQPLRGEARLTLPAVGGVGGGLGLQAAPVLVRVSGGIYEI